MTYPASDPRPTRLDIPICRVHAAPAQVRARDGQEPSGDGTDQGSPMPTLAGHFSAFDTWYEIDSLLEGRFLERTAPGAFTDTFATSGDAIRVLLEHGHDPTVGDKPLGTPEVLAEDETGPYFEVALFDTPYVRQLLPALEAGVYGSSFRFRVLADEWDHDPGTSGHNPEAIPERTITRADVLEFGPTIFPANPRASAGLRSATDRCYQLLAEHHSDQAQHLPARAGPGEIEPAAASPPQPRRLADTTPAPTPISGRSTTMVETMTVEERTERQAEIRSRLAEIDSEFTGAVLPEQIQAEWDSLNTEYDDHQAAIAAASARLERIRALADGDEQTGGLTVAGAHPGQRAHRADQRRVDNIYDLTELRRTARSVDDLAQLTRDNAMRAIDKARFPGATSQADAQARTEQLLTTIDDEAASLARRILVTGSPTYERAFGKALAASSTNGLTTEEQRALSLGSDPAGGFAVPFQLNPTVILTSDGRINPLRTLARQEQIVGKEWQGITSAGITVSRAPETGDGAETGDDAPSFEQPTVRPSRVQGFVPFTIEIEADWNALRGEITRMLADAKEQEEAESFVNGDGTGVNPAGIIATLDAASHVDAGTSFGTTQIYALEEALPPRFRARGAFLANKAIYNRVRQFAEGSDGSDLWVRLGAGRPNELIGYQAAEASTMPATTGAGDRFLLFGDFSEFLIVDRVGMSVELVPHLFGANRRPIGQRGIYAIWRNSSTILVDNAFRLLVGGSEPGGA